MAYIPESRPMGAKSIVLSRVHRYSISLAVLAILLWLIVGTVALFLGSVGGEWGWGFGFDWYFALLSMTIAIMAGIGIAISIAVWAD